MKFVYSRFTLVTCVALLASACGPIEPRPLQKEFDGRNLSVFEPGDVTLTVGFSLAEGVRGCAEYGKFAQYQYTLSTDGSNPDKPDKEHVFICYDDPPGLPDPEA